MRHEKRYDKPWWEQVADYNDVDQKDFLQGVFQGRFTWRQPTQEAYFMGFSSGIRAREFAKPEPITGKQHGHSGLSK